MPKHSPKVDPITFSSAVAESPDIPGRTTGDADDAVRDHNLDPFTEALHAAVEAGVPHGVLRRLVEQHEWDNAPAVR